MAVSRITVTMESPVESVWETATSLENYSWRSDISRIEILNENQFVEYTKEGYATTFTITASEPYQRWEFDMENDNMKGHWSGIFTKKAAMKPFVKAYLKKQQKLYISDLKKALS